MAIVYTRNEERANYLSHGAGAVIALVACLFFFHTVYNRYGPLAQLSIWLYAFGVLSSYLSSTFYHACPMQSKWRESLRKLDHAAIYWHIAGSYSPITLIGLAQRPGLCWSLFIIVWACALLGSFMSFRRLKEHSNLETVCFVAMGMLVVFTFKPVVDVIGWESMGWIIAEGVAFVAGAVFYSFNNRPYMHTVFHGFVLLGTLCHLMAVWIIIR